MTSSAAVPKDEFFRLRRSTQEKNNPIRISQPKSKRMMEK